MATINIVLEGKYKNEKIKAYSDSIYLPNIDFGYHFTPNNVSSYNVIDETNKDQYSYGKAALGVALFGDIGAVAGIGGKSRKEYLIAIEWKDGEKSLILIDDEYYKVLVKSMFK